MVSQLLVCLDEDIITWKNTIISQLFFMYLIDSIINTSLFPVCCMLSCKLPLTAYCSFYTRLPWYFQWWMRGRLWSHPQIPPQSWHQTEEAEGFPSSSEKYFQILVHHIEFLLCKKKNQIQPDRTKYCTTEWPIQKRWQLNLGKNIVVLNNNGNSFPLEEP